MCLKFPELYMLAILGPSFVKLNMLVFIGNNVLIHTDTNSYG